MCSEVIHSCFSTGAVNVAIGGYHTCAVLTNSTIECWGFNGYGQLGTSDTSDRNSPTEIADLVAATCTMCGECTAGQYLSGCVGTSAGLCTACSSNCPVGQYLSGCNGTSAGSCVSYAELPTTNESSFITQSANRSGALLILCI